LYAWARVTLGMEWSSQLQIREHHHLVTKGPYARIRHPIYAALLLFLIAIALITANWLLVLFLLASVWVYLVRIPQEERMMIETFGEAYLAYKEKTGGLFPK
jgi:protein-S-isoprenylcysteine O-methyltransferase Ste14